MATNRQFNLGVDALAKLQLTGRTLPPQTQPIADTSALSRTLVDVGPLPREALFLGIASDGLPVLLNLHDPIPGPMLVIGDEGSGKTAFLKSIAHSIPLIHDATDVQFALITSRPEEWSSIAVTDHVAGMFDVQHEGAQQLISSLAIWAHSNKNAQQSVLLLVDDLESIAKWEMSALQHLRWLLLRGTSRRVWPVLTLTANRYGQVLAWLDIFRTRVFGRVGNPRIAEALGADPAAGLGTLEAGRQFSLRENGNWLQFSIPNF